jgi:hypothetical protein
MSPDWKIVCFVVVVVGKFRDLHQPLWCSTKSPSQKPILPSRKLLTISLTRTGRPCSYPTWHGTWWHTVKLCVSCATATSQQCWSTKHGFCLVAEWVFRHLRNCLPSLADSPIGVWSHGAAQVGTYARLHACGTCSSWVDRHKGTAWVDSIVGLC